MNDATTTLAHLKKLVDGFVKERDWHQFHTPKNISMALSVEAAELMEFFLYGEHIQPGKEQEVAHEMVDILWWLLSLSNRAGIDIAAAFEEKIKLNAQKYPVEKSKGKATKYTDL